MDLERWNLPEHLAAGLRMWAEHGLPQGHFLTAVLSNDLFGAYSRADDTSAAAMQDLVRAIYNELPSGCWGSPEKVDAWPQFLRENPPETSRNRAEWPVCSTCLGEQKLCAPGHGDAGRAPAHAIADDGCRLRGRFIPCPACGEGGDR